MASIWIVFAVNIIVASSINVHLPDSLSRVRVFILYDILVD